MKHYFQTYKHNQHHSLNRLSTRGYSYNQSDPFLAASEIIHDYDFIAIAERLDESLVVLSLLLDIPLGDVLHLDSKRSEGYDGEGGRGRCFWMVPTNLTAEMQSYLETPQWKAHVLAERALYQAARYSLDPLDH
jgi:hypothetical protein